MREARDLLHRIRELTASGEPAVVATIVRVDGSAYRREGARLLIEPDGAMTGVLSGGCVERELLQPAAEVLADGHARTLQFDLSADEEAIWGFGLGCSGTITLLLEPLATAFEALERALSEAIDHRNPVRLTTTFHPADHDSPRVVVERTLEAATEAKTSIEGNSDGRPSATPDPSSVEPRLPLPLQWKSPEIHGAGSPPARTTPTELRNEKSLSSSAPALRAPAGAVVLVESFQPPAHLVVLGAERDVVPLVTLADELGWPVTVVAARPTAAAEARVAGRARYVGAPPRRLADEVRFDRRTAVLVATHRYLDDLAYLGELLDAELGYLGLLGPTKRRERLLADLARQRPEAARLRAALHGPAGLDLGGRSPHEVALAVVAEIQAAIAGGTTGPLSGKSAAGAVETTVGKGA